MVCENELRCEHYDYGTVQTLLRQRIPGTVLRRAESSNGEMA